MSGMSTRGVRIDGTWIGQPGHCPVVAKVANTHCGRPAFTLELVAVAAQAGCAAVSIDDHASEPCAEAERSGRQTEPPVSGLCQSDPERGPELGVSEYVDLDIAARERGLVWFASCADPAAVDFIELFDPPCYRLGPQSVADAALLRHVRAQGRPVLLSTEGCSFEQIDRAVAILGTEQLILLHGQPDEHAGRSELSLRRLTALERRYGVPVGYSGRDLESARIAALDYGACLVEVPVTLDQTASGTSQAHGLEPGELSQLVRELEGIESVALPSEAFAA